MKRARLPQVVAEFDGYEVRINRARTLVFVNTAGGASRVLSRKAALDPETEVRFGVHFPQDVRDAIRDALDTPPVAKEAAR